MRTLTVRKGSGTNYIPGWHKLTISNAKYGDFNGAKFLDVWFDNYPENFTMRVYEKVGTDGEAQTRAQTTHVSFHVTHGGSAAPRRVP